MLWELSIVLEWIKELKLSACRKGIMRALALAKAYHPEMNPALLAGGFPQFNVDNTPFGKPDYARVVKETRQYPTSLRMTWIYQASKSDMIVITSAWSRQIQNLLDLSHHASGEHLLQHHQVRPRQRFQLLPGPAEMIWCLSRCHRSDAIKRMQVKPTRVNLQRASHCKRKHPSLRRMTRHLLRWK